MGGTGYGGLGRGSMGCTAEETSNGAQTTFGHFHRQKRTPLSSDPAVLPESLTLHPRCLCTAHQRSLGGRSRPALSGTVVLPKESRTQSGPGLGQPHKEEEELAKDLTQRKPGVGAECHVGSLGPRTSHAASGCRRPGWTWVWGRAAEPRLGQEGPGEAAP